ncbi:MAG: hypothetical protein R3E77_08220 [Steroidobacteraceae bacterium]
MTNGIGEMGREYFSLTVHADRSRTLRVQCEMDNDRLSRDVTLSIDREWRPQDAFVRLFIADRFVGSSWFWFSAGHAVCEGYTSREGRFSQIFDLAAPVDCFGTHALHGDSWTVGRLRRHAGGPNSFQFVNFASSLLANGGSGPLLVPVAPGSARVHDLGDEEISVPAGEFTARHVRVEVPGVDDFDIWAAGDDCVPVRLTSDGLNQTYELVELAGEWQ